MSKTKPILIGLLILLALSGLGYHIYLRIIDSIPPPAFSFDATRADGWWGSENINVQKVAGNTYQGQEPKERLPVADLTVHHGMRGEDAPSDNCFIMYSYFNYQLGDIATAHKQYVDRKNQSNNEVVPLKPVSQTFTTFEGEKTYELRQYRYEIDDKEALKGYQVGFIPMNEGYVRVEGVCRSVDDLSLTEPILQTVQLNNR